MQLLVTLLLAGLLSLTSVASLPAMAAPSPAQTTTQDAEELLPEELEGTDWLRFEGPVPMPGVLVDAFAAAYQADDQHVWVAIILEDSKLYIDGIESVMQKTFEGTGAMTSGIGASRAPLDGCEVVSRWLGELPDNRSAAGTTCMVTEDLGIVVGAEGRNELNIPAQADIFVFTMLRNLGYDVEVPKAATPLPTPTVDPELGSKEGAIAAVKGTCILGGEVVTDPDYLETQLMVIDSIFNGGIEQVRQGWVVVPSDKVVGGGWLVSFRWQLTNGVTSPESRSADFLYSPRTGRVLRANDLARIYFPQACMP